MSRFTKFHSFEKEAGTYKQYRLTDDVCWEIGKLGSGWQLHIPRNTVFDISVPRCLEWAQSPDDHAVLLAAAVHDELLKRGFDPAFASSEFRRAAIARGVSTPRAWLLFITTLLWTAWR